ncbi:MAB_1171c family putative transporter [Streptomyces sp. NPDC001339]|uniref:MAB_1171c family putative transporter n=1 Tax=Streptomyces sp. NPDC001339 TaxID=3364563 RepID=UPI003678594E
MTSALTAFGNVTHTVGTLALWATILVRLPAVIRSPHQRGLWLAVTSAAAATTMGHPYAVRLVVALTHTPHLAPLAQDLFGVLSAGAVLHFVAFSTLPDAPGAKPKLWKAAGVVLPAMVLLDLMSGPHIRPGAHTPDVPDPSTAYWLLMIGAHLVANTACVVMCRQYEKAGAGRSLRLSLRLFGWGTALAGVFWLGQLARLLLHVQWLTPCLRPLMDLHSLLRAAALLVPVAFALGRSASDIATVWRLWPLWHELARAVPQVILEKPRARLVEILWPRSSWRLLAYRKVIEIRDSVLVLCPHTEPAVLDQARRHVTAAGTEWRYPHAAVLACVLREALRSGDAGRERAGGPERVEALELGCEAAAELADETAFLLCAADAYASPRIREFSVMKEPQETMADG